MYPNAMSEHIQETGEYMTDIRLNEICPEVKRIFITSTSE